MFHHCSAIVLSRMNYSDSGLIVRVYSDKFGAFSLIIKGVRGKKSKISLFQPLNILDLVLRINEKKSLQFPKEYSLKFNMKNIHNDIVKTSLAFFIAEFVYKTVTENEENPLLYNFLENSFRFLDETREPVSNFHFVFMLKYANFLGFGIDVNQNDKGKYFDLEKGVFSSNPVHGNFLNEKQTILLSRLLQSNFSNMNLVKINNADRNELLDSIIQFFYIHVEGMQQLKSKDVLKDIFS